MAKADLLKNMQGALKEINKEAQEEDLLGFIQRNATCFAEDKQAFWTNWRRLRNCSDLNVEQLLADLGCHDVAVVKASKNDLFEACYNMVKSKLWTQFSKWLGESSSGTGSMIFVVGAHAIIVSNAFTFSSDTGFIGLLRSKGKLNDVYWLPWSMAAGSVYFYR